MNTPEFHQQQAHQHHHQQQQQQPYLLNNEGVKLLRNGQFDNAITTLCEAVTLFRNSMQAKNEATDHHLDSGRRGAAEEEQEQEREVYSNNNNNNATTTQEPCFWFTQQMILMKQNKLLNDEDTATTGRNISSYGGSRSGSVDSSETSLSTTTSYVWTRPIMIPDDCTQPAQVHSAVVIFNLALAHYAVGQSRKSSSSSYLIQSVRLYEVCQQLLEIEDIDPGPCFLVALINNMSQIYSMISGYEEKAHYYLDHLLELQMIFVESGYYTAYNDILIEFWQNTSSLILSNCCSARAA